MADFPEFTKDDLAEFSGRAAGSYPPFTTQAISQAVLLYGISTYTDTWPDDPREAMMARLAVLSMADHLVLEQPFQKAVAAPFNSENIGSYSYSKSGGRASAVQSAVSKGEATGVMWFDIAVQQLGQAEHMLDMPMSGGIEVFEWDARFAKGQGHNRRLLSPMLEAELRRRLYRSTLVPLVEGAPAGDFGFEEDTENPGYLIVDDEGV